MLERFRPASVTGPWDRRALLRFASSCLSEIIYHLPRGLLPIIKYHARQGNRVQGWAPGGVGSALGCCSDWGCRNLVWVNSVQSPLRLPDAEDLFQRRTRSAH